MKPKVLMVDDEKDILDGYRRVLRKQFDLRTAQSGSEGLSALAEEGPFSVVVSDLSMPGMDGISFLSAVRKQARDTVRIMLTGYADVPSAIEAVNTGNIFRFLTKPCSPEMLISVLEAGVDQYRLIHAERELLEKTLKGAIKILSDVLSLTNPTAFGRASRVQRLVTMMAREMKMKNTWIWEIAAMLSQVGCVTLPNDLLEKLSTGSKLMPAQEEMFLDHPRIGAELISNVPRLKPVSDIVRYQEKYFDGSGPPDTKTRGRDIPLGARVLRVALSYDTLLSGGKTSGKAISEIRKAGPKFDPELVEVLNAVILSENKQAFHSVSLNDLQPGMIIMDNIVSAGGALLVAKGQEVTTSLVLRLKNVSRNMNIKDPISVQKIE